VWDDAGKARAKLKVARAGTGFGLFDKNGNCRLRLGAVWTTTLYGKQTKYPESSIVLFNADEMVLWEAP